MPADDSHIGVCWSGYHNAASSWVSRHYWRCEVGEAKREVHGFRWAIGFAFVPAPESNQGKTIRAFTTRGVRGFRARAGVVKLGEHDGRCPGFGGAMVVFLVPAHDSNVGVFHSGLQQRADAGFRAYDGCCR